MPALIRSNRVRCRTERINSGCAVGRYCSAESCRSGDVVVFGNNVNRAGHLLKEAVCKLQRGAADFVCGYRCGENITIIRGNRCNGFILNTPCKVEIREQIPDIGMCADGVSLAGAEIYNTVGKLAGVVDSGAIIALDANKQAVARIIA